MCGRTSLVVVLIVGWAGAARALTPTPTATHPRVQQEEAPAAPGSPSVTPTRSITPTGTETPTVTATRPRVAQDELPVATDIPTAAPTFGEGQVDEAPTETPTNGPSPTPTDTPSVTPTETFTRTPTLTPTRVRAGQDEVPPTATPACGSVVVQGTVLNVNGGVAANRTVTFQIRKTQALRSGCVLRPSTWSVKTDSGGQLPAGTTVVGGAVVQITIQQGGVSEVLVPVAGPVDIGVLLTHPTPQPTDSLTSIVVQNAGQYRLTVNGPDGYGTATLVPGRVTNFTLAGNGDANGHLIRGMPTPAVVGNPLAVGETVGGDLTGTLPNIVLAKPPLAGQTVVAGGQVIAAGACLRVTTMVLGATSQMAVVVSAESDPGTGLVWNGWVPYNNAVSLNLCAVANATTNLTAFDIRVIQ